MTSVTAAPTRASAPSAAGQAVGIAASNAAASGKDPSVTGQVLPPRREIEPPANVADTVQKLNELMAQRQRSLSFRIDEASGRTVITVLDESTSEVVRQIPAEEVLVLARALERTGALVDAQI